MTRTITFTDVPEGTRWSCTCGRTGTDGWGRFARRDADAHECIDVLITPIPSGYRLECTGCDSVTAEWDHVVAAYLAERHRCPGVWVQAPAEGVGA